MELNRRLWELVPAKDGNYFRRIMSALPSVAGSLRVPSVIRSLFRPGYFRLVRTFGTSRSSYDVIRSEATPLRERVIEFANEQQDKANVFIMDARDYQASNYGFNVNLIRLSLYLYYANKIADKK